MIPTPETDGVVAMTDEFKDTVMVVTGAAGGVGQAVPPALLALGLGGPLFAVAAVVAQDQQRLQVLQRLLPLGEVVDESMDRQIGITADRRGEVAVALAR